MRPIAYLIIISITLGSCSSSKKRDYFPAADVDQIQNTESIVPTAPMTKVKPRNPAGGWKNLFKWFSEKFYPIVKFAKKEKAPVFSILDRSVAREGTSHIPALMGKEFKNTTELGDEISKLRNADETQVNALTQSIKPLANEFGLEAGAALNALKQVEIEAGLKNLAPDINSVPRFDVKNTENTAGTFLHELREKSASGEVYTFVVGGKMNDLFKAKDTNGKTLWMTGQKLMSKNGALSGYHYGCFLRQGELEFMDVQTRKEFESFLKAYKRNHPDAQISTDIEVFRTQSGMKQHLIVFDAFMKVKMKEGKRVALIMEDAHLYLGDVQKGGGLNPDALDIVKKWNQKNPALNAEGEVTSAHFTNIIATDDYAKLANDLVGDTEIPLINFPSLSLDDRAELIDDLFLDTKNEAALADGFTKKDFAKSSGGLSAKEIERLVKDAVTRGRKITSDELLGKVKESLEKRFSKYKTADGKSIFTVEIVNENRISAVQKANKRQLGFIGDLLDYRFKNGAFDSKNSIGMMLLGGQGSGKTTIARHIAQERKSLLITINRYSTEYHGSGAALASDVRPIAASVENAVWLFDEFDSIPSRANTGGVNDMIARDNNAAAGIWKQIFSETPLNKNGSIFIAATANPQTVGSEYLRPGRFNPGIPLSFLTEIPERRAVIDEIFEKFRDKVGTVDSKIFSDDLIERLPVKDPDELEVMIKEAIARKKGAGALKAKDMEEAVNNKTIFRSEPLPDLREQEFNRIFYTSDNAKDLLPEYVKRIPADEFAKAKEAYQMSGGKLQPNWPLPTWMTGNGKK